MSDLTAAQRAFLEALTKLSREHGIVIKGCGCCGSPYLTEVNDKKDVFAVPPDGRYSAEDAGQNLEWVGN